MDSVSGSPTSTPFWFRKTFLVSENDIFGEANGAIHKYDINGTYHGEFADNIELPFGLLKVDDETIAFACYSGILFFDLEGNDSTTYSKIVNGLGAKHTTLVDDNVIFFKDYRERVQRACLDNSCSQRTTIIKEFDIELRGIAVIPNSDNYLVVEWSDKVIWMCSMSSSTECSVFAEEGIVLAWHSIDLMIADSVVYVLDYSYDKIWAYTLEGELIYDLDLAIGDFNMASQLAIRPGIFAPLSKIIITETSDLTFTAGELMSFSLDLRDDRSNAITASYPDPSRFTVFAEGSVEVNGFFEKSKFLSKSSRAKTTNSPSLVLSRL